MILRIKMFMIEYLLKYLHKNEFANCIDSITYNLFCAANNMIIPRYRNKHIIHHSSDWGILVRLFVNACDH